MPSLACSLLLVAALLGTTQFAGAQLVVHWAAYNDYVPGLSLSEVAREKLLSPKQAARYVQKIAGAIHYAHQRGILHRDLKPSNVLIDENDEPRVADFGLAKLMAGDSEMTMSGTVMGSPSHMPPEQAR
jgi:serine/threonine protein kinase